MAAGRWAAMEVCGAAARHQGASPACLARERKSKVGNVGLVRDFPYCLSLGIFHLSILPIFSFISFPNLPRQTIKKKAHKAHINHLKASLGIF
jgi:hypothetical protein